MKTIRLVNEALGITLELPQKNEVVIGRDPDQCDVATPPNHTSITRKGHCRITQKDEEIFIQDLGSKNGTKIGEGTDQFDLEDAPETITDGDIIILGGLKLTVKIEDPDATQVTNVPAAEEPTLAPAAKVDKYSSKDEPVAPIDLPKKKGLESIVDQDELEPAAKETPPVEAQPVEAPAKETPPAEEEEIALVPDDDLDKEEGSSASQIARDLEELGGDIEPDEEPDEKDAGAGDLGELKVIDDEDEKK